MLANANPQAGPMCNNALATRMEWLEYLAADAYCDVLRTNRILNAALVYAYGPNKAPEMRLRFNQLTTRQQELVLAFGKADRAYHAIQAEKRLLLKNAASGGE